jgi:thiamine transport system permease protein
MNLGQMAAGLRLAENRSRAVTWKALALWLLPLLFLGFFFFYPLVAIFRLVFSPIPLIPGAPGLDASSGHAIWRPLWFTLWQASLSTGLTLLVGLPAAYLFARFKFPGKSLLSALTTLPFILPTVVVAAGFNALLGPNGWVNLALMDIFNLATPPVHFLNTLWAILLAHIFYNTTIVIRTVGNAWMRLDNRLGLVAQVLGASPRRAFWEVTLPLLRPSIQAAALLVFLFDFTSFGVILMLGGPAFSTLEVAIYTQAMQMLNLPLAGLLSLVQMAFTIGLTAVYNLGGGRHALALSPRPVVENMRRPRTVLEKVIVIGLVSFLLVLLVSPLAALALRSVTRLEANRGERGLVAPGLTLDYYQALFVNRKQSIFYVPPVQAVRNSLMFAGVTVAFAMTLGLLATYGLKVKARINRWLDPLLMLPLGASAVTLGLGFVVVFNRPPLDNQSFPFLVSMAHTLVALPFVVRSLFPAVGSIPPHLSQSASILGASPWRTWLEIDLPIIARAALGSAIFAFTLSLGEFGANSFLARADLPTLPVAIYRFISQPGGLNYGQALAMSTLLMLVCGLGILIIERLRLPGLGDF